MRPDAASGSALVEKRRTQVQTEHEAEVREVLKLAAQDGGFATDAVFRLVREFLIALIVQAQRAGELVDGDPAVLAELALRLGASFVLMPDSVLPLSDEAAANEVFRALIAPAVRTD